MKKIIACFLMVGMIVVLCACGNTNDSANNINDAVVEETSGNVMSTDYINIEGLYVDNSYAGESESIKFVFVVYEAFTNAENLSIDCKSMQMTINGTNTYTAARTSAEVKYMKNYYNGAYLKSVNIGERAKFVETFEIPQGDLEPGRTITLAKSQIPQMEKISFSTDDLVFCNSPEEIAQLADPEGYEQEVWAMQDASADVVQAVMNEVNGYQWSVTVDSLRFEIEFWAQNEFEVRSGLGANQGSYSVKNGYIECTYYNGAGTLLVPYTYENGVVDIDAISAFDFNK